jgi:hypothetical protein
MCSHGPTVVKNFQPKEITTFQASFGNFFEATTTSTDGQPFWAKGIIIIHTHKSELI